MVLGMISELYMGSAGEAKVRISLGTSSLFHVGGGEGPGGGPGGSDPPPPNVPGPLSHPRSIINQDQTSINRLIDDRLLDRLVEV